MNRRQAREVLFSLIFAHDFLDNATEEEFQNGLDSLDAKEDPYIRSGYYGILENTYALDQDIAQYSVGWKTERLTRTSSAIMRLAIYEMENVEDVPAAVAINEAVELAKKYDNDNAPAFINGILNAVAKGKGLLQ